MAAAMAEGPSIKEGRLKRWSRLKRSGDETETEPTATATATVDGEEGYSAPDPHGLPGGAAIRRGATVPAMPSLIVEHDEQGETVPVLSDNEAALEEQELTPEEQKIASQLPPIESLTKDSDFTPFLAEKVPELIRKRAMSILWRSDPVLANLDGLNDYDENYRIIDTLISAAQDTVYRVGKGHKTNEELEAEAKTELDPESEASDELGAGSGHERKVDFEESTPDGKLPKDKELNAQISTDAPDDPNEMSDIQDKEALISGSIRKPNNPV